MVAALTLVCVDVQKQYRGEELKRIHEEVQVVFQGNSILELYVLRARYGGGGTGEVGYEFSMRLTMYHAQGGWF